MSILIPTLRRLLSLLWYGFATCTILTAVLLVTARVLLPLAGHYRGEIVAQVQHSLGRPIQVGGLEPQWHGLGPVIVLKDVRVLDHPGGKVLLSLDQARVGIDLVSSLFHGRLMDSHLTVTGVGITLMRRPDGRLGIEGFGSVATGGAAGRRNLEQVQDWLQAQRNVTIADSDIYWHGAGDAAALHFAHVNLTLRNRGARHHVSVSVLLPGSLGRTLDAALAFRGPLLQVGQWTGLLYVKGASLSLPGPFAHRAYGGITVGDGVADVRAWGRLAGGTLQDLEGDVQIDALQLASAGAANHPGDRPPALKIKALGGRFHWRRHEQGWILDADRAWLAEGDRVTPQTRLRVFTQRGGDGRQIEAQFGYLRLEDAAALLRLSGRGGPALQRLAGRLRPVGVLRHAYVHLDAPTGKPVKPYVYVQFADVGTRAPWHGVPAFSGLKGVLQGTPSAATLTLDSRFVVVPKGELLRGNVHIDRLGGRITWRRNAGIWQVSSRRLHVRNRDLDVDARFVMKGGSGFARPFVDLVADLRNGNLGHAARYLPAARMNPHAVAWLDRALVKGTVASGAVLVHGNLADFPFDRHQGVFQVRLNVEDAIVDYSPKWPRLEEVQAEVKVDGRALAVEASQAKVLNSTITRFHGRIADLAARPALLTFTGDATGPTRDALYIATHTPLEEKVGKYLKGAAVAGNSRLSLAMRFPLSPAPKQTDGKLVFQDSTLILGNRLHLTAINGPLRFTGKGLRSRGIRARMMGYPATIKAGTEDGRDGHVIYFTADGHTDVPHIRRLKFPDLPFLKYVQGGTDWQARLQVTTAPHGGGPTLARLEIRSALRGMSVDLPAPLAKAKGDALALEVIVGRLGQATSPVYFRYGDRLSGAFVTPAPGAGQGIERGEFRFGNGIARLPGAKGLYIGGKLDRFSLAEWRRYFPAEPGGGTRASLGGLAGVDVHVGALQAFGWRLHKVQLQARRDAKRWSAKVHSEELAGSVDAPLTEGSPVAVDLDYLHLKAGTLHDKGARLDPRKLPSLRLSGKQVTYDGKPFGGVALTLTRRPQGVHIEKLTVDSHVMKITASGDWTEDGQGEYSAFEANITSQDIGKTLSRFGYVGTIEDGRGQVQLTAVWQGAPTDMDVKTLDGSLSLDLSKGRLLDVDPGAGGRILGILSLQALPRRLTLDFSDLFEKGFSFDSMKGDFAIRSGQAHTDNLVMEGPSARVDVVGRVGLVSRDYDQTVTVTPHLTSGLPLAGVLASGVGVGVAILLFQKIFEDQIDEMTRVRYTITGSWKKPIVQPLHKGKKSGSDQHGKS